MCVQLLTVPRQSMAGTWEFFKTRPAGPLIGCERAECSGLNRACMSRMLDAVCEAGPERICTLLAGRVAGLLGIKPSAVRIDSASFRYDGRTRSEEGVSVFPRPGMQPRQPS